MGGIVFFLWGNHLPYVRRTKRRPSVSRKLKMTAIACLALAVALGMFGLYSMQQQRISQATQEAASYTPAPLAIATDVVHLAAVGDSFTGGSDVGGYKEANWTEVVADELSTEDANVSASKTGLGGSGYVNRGPNGKVFGEVIGETFNTETDVTVLFGSINDRLQPLPEVEAAANKAIEQAKQAAPNADLVVIGPAWMRTDIPDEIFAIRDTLEALATEHGVTFVDPLEERWFLDSPELIGSDGTHPTDEGHAYMAEMIAPHLTPLLD